MDGERFDAVTEVLGRNQSRRGVLRLLGAAAVGAVTASAATGADARRKRKNSGMSWREICELERGTYTPSPLGGFTCKFPGGWEMRCDSSGQRCITICHVKQGCDCNAGIYNFCDTSLVHSPSQGNTMPIGGVAKR